MSGNRLGRQQRHRDRPPRGHAAAAHPYLRQQSQGQASYPLVYRCLLPEYRLERAQTAVVGTGADTAGGGADAHARHTLLGEPAAAFRNLSAARLKPTVIDHYLTTLVEHYGDRRNCTVILPTAPTGTYREPDRDTETGRYRIASGMEAVWVILHEEAWNEGGAWKFIIDDITYTVE